MRTAAYHKTKVRTFHTFMEPNSDTAIWEFERSWERHPAETTGSHNDLYEIEAKEILDVLGSIYCNKTLRELKNLIEKNV